MVALRRNFWKAELSIAQRIESSWAANWSLEVSALRLDACGGGRRFYKGDHELRTLGGPLLFPGVQDPLFTTERELLPGINQLAHRRGLFRTEVLGQSELPVPPAAPHILYVLCTRRRGPGIYRDRQFNGL